MADLENISIEDGGKVSEGGEGVSEAAMGIVTENIKKAKKVQAQIQQQTAHNHDLAQMLSLILSKVNDDEIIKKIIRLLSDNIDILEIFSLFVPFLYAEISMYPNLQKIFPDQIIVNGITDYSSYTKKIFTDSNTLKNIEKNLLIGTIMDIILFFDLGGIQDIVMSDGESKSRLYSGLEKDIYNLND